MDFYHHVSGFRFAGEQGVRYGIVVHIVLDTVHDHVVHVPCDIQGGQPAGEADPRADQLRSADELRPGDGGKSAPSSQRRGQRVVVQDHAGAERPSFDPVPGEQELHQDEEGTQGGQDIGNHHGHVHRLLVAVFPLVSCVSNDFSLFLSGKKPLENTMPIRRPFLIDK